MHVTCSQIRTPRRMGNLLSLPGTCAIANCTAGRVSITRTFRRAAGSDSKLLSARAETLGSAAAPTLSPAAGNPQRGSSHPGQAPSPAPTKAAHLSAGFGLEGSRRAQAGQVGLRGRILSVRTGVGESGEMRCTVGLAGTDRRRGAEGGGQPCRTSRGLSNGSPFCSNTFVASAAMTSPTIPHRTPNTPSSEHAPVPCSALCSSLTSPLGGGGGNRHA